MLLRIREQSSSDPADDPYCTGVIIGCYDSAKERLGGRGKVNFLSFGWRPWVTFDYMANGLNQ